MPEAVCCPKCWTWDELGKRTACKRCGTPLILADGRTVTEAAAQGNVAPLVPVFAGNAQCAAARLQAKARSETMADADDLELRGHALPPRR